MNNKITDCNSRKCKGAPLAHRMLHLLIQFCSFISKNCMIKNLGRDREQHFALLCQSGVKNTEVEFKCNNLDWEKVEIVREVNVRYSEKVSPSQNLPIHILLSRQTDQVMSASSVPAREHLECSSALRSPIKTKRFLFFLFLVSAVLGYCAVSKATFSKFYVFITKRKRGFYGA